MMVKVLLLVVVAISTAACTTSPAKPGPRQAEDNVRLVDQQLIESAGRGQREGVDAALLEGADIDATTKAGYSALFLATRNGQFPMVDYLLQKGATLEGKTHDTGSSLIHMAALSRDVRVVSLLRKRGLKLDEKSPAGSPVNLARGLETMLMESGRSEEAKRQREVVKYFEEWKRTDRSSD